MGRSFFKPSPMKSTFPGQDSMHRHQHDHLSASMTSFFQWCPRSLKPCYLQRGAACNIVVRHGAGATHPRRSRVTTVQTQFQTKVALHVDVAFHLILLVVCGYLLSLSFPIFSWVARRRCGFAMKWSLRRGIQRRLGTPFFENSVLAEAHPNPRPPESPELHIAQPSPDHSCAETAGSEL